MPDSAAAAPVAAATSYIDAISATLREEMRRDPSVFLMGQDLAE